MTTEEERRERFDELVRELAELKENLDSMVQRQQEQLDRGRKRRLPLTTEEERRERFDELVRKLAELKEDVDSMVQRQQEQLDRVRKMLDDQDLNGDGG